MDNRKTVGAFNTYDIYKDMSIRTGGEIYIGVVGAVRTGKSTFVRRFMEELILPKMQATGEKERTQDEMPQSGEGRTITTTEPKFIPKQAAEIKVDEKTSAKFRLIDCVGYMIEGATGHLEEDKERMVMTPWSEQPMPFSKAAEYGTEKVIREHANIGIVVTTDGSFGEIPAENYIPAQDRTIRELKEIGKPFVVVVNSTRPFSEAAKKMAMQLEEKYDVRAIPCNVSQMKKDEIIFLLGEVLQEFPIKTMCFYLPKWVEMLEAAHPIKKEALRFIRFCADNIRNIRELNKQEEEGALVKLKEECVNIKNIKKEEVCLSQGRVLYDICFEDSCYYHMLSELLEEPIGGEYELMEKLKELCEKKHEYEAYNQAICDVKQSGYGVVLPQKEEIRLEAPEVIRSGSKFGVRMKAYSPSVHMIRADIETEIAPIVGNEEQAEDLMEFLKGKSGNHEDIWDTNIFGKSVKQLVEDGIRLKTEQLSGESRVKLQDTMQQIVNNNNGKLVCFII